MRDLPPPPPLNALREAERVSLFLDFDGTLVDLAPEPDAIAPPPAIARRLAALEAELDGRLAIVTGRSLDNLQQHTGPLAIAMAGSHGAHCLGRDGKVLGNAPVALDAEMVEELRAFATREGFHFERKSHGAALHYRSDPSLEDRGLAFARDLADRADLEIKRGKAVIEIVHPGSDKGSAVRAFMQEPVFAGSVPIFVGDDVTDEDGMHAAGELGGFGILVGSPRDSAARYRFDTPQNVLNWLDI